MIGAVAEITVKEGSQDEFEKAALELEQAVNANEPAVVAMRSAVSRLSLARNGTPSSGRAACPSS